MKRHAVFLFVVTLCAAPDAGAAPTESEHRSAPEFGLTFRGGPVNTEPAPALRTNVSIDVTGIIARVHIRQTFRNPDDAWVEGVYTFPLPDKAAVDELQMRIGDRTVTGEIRERETAHSAYVQARRNGQRASLIEQERPNIFTASVANIPPHGDVAVEIGYQQRLRFADGSVTLRFPSVIGPRYIPGTRQIAGAGGMGWAVNTDAVQDAERITPPVRHPSSGEHNPLTISVRLDPGMPLTFLRSPSHAIAATDAGNGRFLIGLRNNDAAADRDFILEWQPHTGTAPFAALFRERKGTDTYLLAIVAPPSTASAEGPLVSRDIVFVIDTSGSMHGESIAQARAALRFALDRLHPGDRFDIVRFANEASALFGGLQPATAGNRRQAAAFIDRLDANGGTNVESALARVLDGTIGGTRLRQIVLVTDGAVGNEAALFRRIRRDIGDARLFTVGIGSAPNSHFMRRAAAFGRGTFTHIGAVQDVAQTMSNLFGKLEKPALTRIAAAIDGTPLTDQQPPRLPDLYHGEPVVLTARLPKEAGAIVISGMRGGTRWSRALDLSTAHDGTGIAKLWARDGIAAAMDGLTLGEDASAVRLAVLDLSLAHGLVSKYTSLVAIDRTPVRPANATLDRRAVPVDLPAGWTYAKVFGARTATPATLNLILGAAALLLALFLFLVRRHRAA